jgi:hypothetical protein
MKYYEERVLAYFDILGFSEEIINTINKDTEEEIELKTEKINNLFENVLELKNKKLKLNDNKISSKIVSHFSDSVAISYVLEEEAGIFHILSDILFFCLSILQNGYLIRGAITSGKLHHTKNKLYGPAMLTAYDMEQKLALYPRVVFEKKIITIADKYPDEWLNKSLQAKALKKLFQKDFDGLYYLNYFDAIDYIFGATEGLLICLKSFRNKIIELQEKIDKNISIKSKYLWLKEKYNIALKYSKKKYVKEKIRTECPSLYDFLLNEEYK